MLLTVAGIVTLVRTALPANALVPMLVTGSPLSRAGRLSADNGQHMPVGPVIVMAPALVVQFKMTCHHGTAGQRSKVELQPLDRKSTRLNSSHRCISYAVFC